MSESTLQRPAASEPEPVQPPPDPAPARRIPPGVYRYRWPLSAAALVLFSFALLHVVGTRPGYDPYGWMIWGYQTLHLSLDLGGAPSWKPLTWLFDVPFALFGHAALWLWLTTAVSLALAGPIFAGRLAHRLGQMLGFGPVACWVAAAFAGASLLGIQNYMHYVFSAQSDPVIVTFCLAAIDCYLNGRPRWALALGVLAALGRPEAWPFLGLYAIFAWRRLPATRGMVVAGLALVPLLWFGVPWITNGKPLIAGTLALDSPRALHGNKIIGTVHRFVALHYLEVELLAVATVALAWLRRNLPLALLIGFSAGWLIVEVAFVLHGWPGVPRYLFEPAATVAVLAGVTIGWIWHEAPRLRVPQARWVGPAAVGAMVLILVPAAVSRLRFEHRDLRRERTRTNTINRLEATVAALGGARRVNACAPGAITIEYVSILAWNLHLNTGVLGRKPKVERHSHHPAVFFLPLPNGWSVLPWHLHAAARRAGCESLKGSYVFTRGHPQGERARFRPGAFF